MDKKKVSFDFDSCLDYETVQHYAATLLARNYDVWVCTARQTAESAHNLRWNDDLYKVTDYLGIPRENIIFTEFADKYEVFKDSDFIWHLEDNFEEADNISEFTDTVGIRYYSKGDWREQCEKLLC